MATMAAETLNDNSFYFSERTSPRNVCFYSAPASPARQSFESSYDIPETDQTPPREEYEDANTSFNEFEFETSRPFNVEDDDHSGDEGTEAWRWNFESPCKQKQQQQQQYQRKESLPSMAFADELFCDGKVMPLEPPPPFQYNNENMSTPGLCSMKSPVMKFQFSQRSLWNDDYDPFTAALQNVREENREKVHRRARSISLLRAISLPKLDKQKEIKESEQKEKQNLMVAKANSFADYSICAPNRNRQNGCQETMQNTPMRLAKPKGVLFARLVKMGQEKLTKPSSEKLSRKESGKESEDSCNKESKTKNSKIFLFRSSSTRRKSNEEKAKEEREVLPKQSFTWKFSSKSKGLAQYNEDKRVSEAANMTLMQYRPKLFLCMGFGTTKYVK